jgi:hypothetical protein
LPKLKGGRVFVLLSTIVQLLVFVGFIVLAKPTTLAYKDPVLDVQLYNLFLAITLMIFVGFGYLMTFLRFYGLGAVGLTMFIACLGMQVSIMLEGAMEHDLKAFEVNMLTLLKGDFAVAAFLISFGGLIGKVNPAQLVVLICLECVFYSANNQYLMVRWLNIKDCGGSIVIHMFGAYFGLRELGLGAARKQREGEKFPSLRCLLASGGSLPLDLLAVLRWGAVAARKRGVRCCAHEHGVGPARIHDGHLHRLLCLFRLPHLPPQ